MGWGKKDGLGADEKLDTILGKGSSFEGALDAAGGVRIDGRFKGSVKTSGDVIVGEGAHESFGAQRPGRRRTARTG